MAQLNRLTGWFFRHRSLLAYLLFTSVVIVLFAVDIGNRGLIAQNARDRGVALCEEQNENRALIFDLIDHNVDQWGADRIELAASIEDPALRRMVLELIQQQEEFREYVRDRTGQVNCYAEPLD